MCVCVSPRLMVAVWSRAPAPVQNEGLSRAEELTVCILSVIWGQPTDVTHAYVRIPLNYLTKYLNILKYVNDDGFLTFFMVCGKNILV